MKPGPRLAVWPPLPPGGHLRPRRRALPYPLDSARCRLYARARHGLWHGLRAVGLRAGDAVLVPAYHHGSEVETVVRAGLEPRFYEATETLEPDETELEHALADGVRALYLVHYLGFPQDAARWRRWCDERELLLVEDAAQAWLAAGPDGQPAGTRGDLAVFCLYKTLGVPDGAALVAADGGEAGASDATLGVVALARKHAAWVAGRSGLLASALAPFDRPAPYDPARDFALGEVDSAPARTTRWLLPKLADPAAASRRRENYRFLLETLGPRVPPPFDVLPALAAPFAFPVEAPANEKNALLDALRGRRIDALDFWSVAHPALPDGFPAAARRRATTVCLPVHQELRRRDLERIAAAVADSGPRSWRRGRP